MTTTSLIDLLATLHAMSVEEREELDFAALPTFGGEEPADTAGVWSWDADSLLVGTCVADFEIVPRPTPARGPWTHDITLTDTPIKWRELLAGWDTGDGTFEELLASFGLDATDALDEADEAFDGECKVWIERNFYAGTLGDTRDGYYRDPEAGDNEPTLFESFAIAQAWVEETEGSPYYLSHGEAGRPSYTICKA